MKPQRERERERERERDFDLNLVEKIGRARSNAAEGEHTSTPRS
jgi:hypothetical protein